MTVLLRRDQDTDTEAQAREGTGRRRLFANQGAASGENSPAHAWISDLQPPGLRENDVVV